MPIQYEFVGEVLVGRAIGSYPISGLDAALAAAVADPARPALRGALLDVRASESVGHRTVPQIRDTALLIAAMSRSFGRRVALLAGTDLQYGVMRMIAAWAEGSGIEVGVFRDEREAFAWVGRETRAMTQADTRRS